MAEIILKNMIKKFEGDAILCSLKDEQLSLIKKSGKNKIVFGIRPEDIEVSREQTSQCSIASIIYFKQSMGAEDILNLKSGELVFRAIAPPSLEAKIGENVYINFLMDRSHLFDPETEERI